MPVVLKSSKQDLVFARTECELGYEGDQESEEEGEETSSDEEAPRRRNGCERFSSVSSCQPSS